MESPTHVTNTNIYDYSDLLRIEFLENCPADLMTIGDDFLTPDKSLVEVSLFCKEYLKAYTTKLTGYDNETILIRTEPTAEFPIYVSLSRRHGRASEPSNCEITISICAAPTFAASFLEHLDKHFRRTKARVSWWYFNKGQAQHLAMSLPPGQPIYNEFYPWFKQGPLAYFKEFLASTSPILLMNGEPGTGKTSFLRSMIEQNNLSAYVGYDTKLFESDGMFIDFMAGSADIMILEDAESLLLPRKKGDNCMMSRFLNVSDGLIKFPNKKFVFTTNENDFNNIDPALIRPGRCFDSVEFRKLTLVESIKVTDIIKEDTPHEDRTYSLAELFNSKRNIKIPKFGF